MNNFKPILAATLLPSDIPCNDETVMKAMSLLRYPVLATIKKDGVRALRMKMPYLASRTLKWIPNEELCARAMSLPTGYDMELWNPELDYNEIQSIVMTEKADASKIQFHVLDNFNTLDQEYRVRIHKELYKIQDGLVEGCEIECPILCKTPQMLFGVEKSAIEIHSEGICFRTPDSPYFTGRSQNRSSLEQQYLVKHCRWIYEDCIITDFKEQYENTNDIKRNAVGKMDRSKSIEGMVPKNTLGAFTVKNTHGVTFDVGNGQGLTEALRQVIWNHRDVYLGKTIIVKSKAHGVKNKPRSPIYWGQREEGY